MKLVWIQVTGSFCGQAVRVWAKMSYLLESLRRKEDVDKLILDTIDKVLVLRIGRASDVVCMQLDEIVSVFFLSLRFLEFNALVALYEWIASCSMEGLMS